MTEIDDIPILCTNLIATHLGKLCDDEIDAATSGASLALVAKGYWCQMSAIVYDVVDPGSENEKNAALALNAQKRAEWDAEFKELVFRYDCSEFKLDKLKAECKRFGIKCSGTKAVLADNIAEYIKHRILMIDACLVKAKPLNPQKCQIRPCAKRWIRALKDPETMLNVTAVKERYKLKDKDLDEISCELKDNPYHRSRPPMRLYKVVDLIPLYNARGGQEDNAKYWDFLTPEKHAADHKADAKEIDKCEKKKAKADEVDRIRNEITFGRKKILIDELTKLECTLRDDSKLCNQFISNGVGNPFQIAQIMREMKFYYDETTYARDLNDIFMKRNRQRENRYGRDRYSRYDSDDYDSDDDDPQDDSDNAKSMALNKWVEDKLKTNKPHVHHLTLPSTLRKTVAEIAVYKQLNKIDEKYNGEIGGKYLNAVGGDRRLLRTRLVNEYCNDYEVNVLERYKELVQPLNEKAIQLKGWIEDLRTFADNDVHHNQIVELTFKKISHNVNREAIEAIYKVTASFITASIANVKQHAVMIKDLVNHPDYNSNIPSHKCLSCQKDSLTSVRDRLFTIKGLISHSMAKHA